jgi:hypothetical protein
MSAEKRRADLKVSLAFAAGRAPHADRGSVFQAFLQLEVAGHDPVSQDHVVCGFK